MEFMAKNLLSNVPQLFTDICHSLEVCDEICDLLMKIHHGEKCVFSYVDVYTLANV